MRWSPLILALLLPAPLTLAATTVEPIPASTQPATQPGSRLFLSVSEILDRTPDSLRARPGKDWLKNTKPQFDAWLNKQAAGMIVDDEIHFAGAIISRGPNARDPRTEWLVRCSSVAYHLPRFGSTSYWQIDLPVLHTDEASAKQWQSCKVGAPLRLTGTIKSISVDSTVAIPGKIPILTFTISLDNPQLTLPNNAPRTTNPAR